MVANNVSPLPIPPAAANGRAVVRHACGIKGEARSEHLEPKAEEEIRSHDPKEKYKILTNNEFDAVALSD